MHTLAQSLRNLASDRLLENEPMSRHTTFRVGGPAELVFFPSSAEELTLALKEAHKAQVPVHLLGNGSNLLVRDGGLKGLTIIMGENYAQIQVEGTRVHAQAGARLSRIASMAQESGLAGLEFAAGIPGTLGGGCVMNAGAYGGQISDVLVEAEVLLEGERRVLSLAEMEMGYRTSMPLRRGGIVLSACFELTPARPEDILQRMLQLNAQRREKQPLNLPSAGSTFKRPEGNYAGALIERCGLKGFSIGGAQVSEKHAGFVVNRGNASAGDILALIAHIQQVVKERTGVELEPEVRILGED